MALTGPFGFVIGVTAIFAIVLGTIANRLDTE